MQDGTRVAGIIVASGVALGGWRIAKLAEADPFYCLLGFVAIMLLNSAIAAAAAVNVRREVRSRKWWSVGAVGLLLVAIYGACQLPSAFLAQTPDSLAVPATRR